MSGETVVIMVVSSQWQIHKGRSAGVLAWAKGQLESERMQAG